MKYEIGEIVYLVTDPEQHARIITGINIRKSGVQYELAFETSASWHYDFEMSRERDIIKATSN